MRASPEGVFEKDADALESPANWQCDVPTPDEHSGPLFPV